jgi:hypothetical protein
MDLMPPDALIAHRNKRGFYSEVTHILTELKNINNDFIWTKTISRRLRFLKRFEERLRSGIWPEWITQIDEGAPNMEWSIEVQDGSKDFHIIHTVEELSPVRLELSLEFSPAPEENDFIEYTLSYRSKLIAPIFREASSQIPPLIIKGNKYLAFDGTVMTAPTQKLRNQFRFPREYGLQPADVAHFVASYSSRIDYLLENEIKRVELKTESFGGNLTVDMTINKPMAGHMYGVAWNPPIRE